MKHDYRCWITGKDSCDGKCDSHPIPKNECGWQCQDCGCTSCNQAGAIMTAEQPQKDRFMKCTKGFTCNDCGLFGGCESEPPCSRPHTPAPAEHLTMLSEDDAMKLINEAYEEGINFGAKQAAAEAKAEVLEALDGPETKIEDFLEWVADRLQYVYKDAPRMDFIISLRERAKTARTLRQQQPPEQP
jgi:hypothetical protein